jgi:hypothetical protein
MFASSDPRAYRSPRRFGTLLALLALVVAGLLLASQGGRVTDASSVTPAALHTGAVSCGATGFVPDDSDVTYTLGSGHWRYLTGSSIAHFSCEVSLPNKAVVTRVRFTLADFDATAQVSGCRLDRRSLATSTAANAEVLAAVHATGTSAQPGSVQLTDSTIAHATISNTGYWYTLECALGAGPNVGIYGASISYTTSS